jgi:hypothetical protein
MKFKTPEVETRFKDMHPIAQKIAIEMDSYAQTNFKIELTLTTTVSTRHEDRSLGRVSDTHRTRRAFDVRTYDLPEAVIAEIIAVFNKKYGKLGAVASAKPQLIVHKPQGSGPHLHVQLNRNHALKEIDYGKETKEN